MLQSYARKPEEGKGMTAYSGAVGHTLRLREACKCGSHAHGHGHVSKELRACTAVTIIVGLLGAWAWFMRPLPRHATVTHMQDKQSQLDQHLTFDNSNNAKGRMQEFLPRTAEDGGVWGNLTHLVVVAGHTVFTGRDLGRKELNPKDWSLEEFQKEQLDAFVGHIKEGVKIASSDEESMLIFSGGVTRRHAGPRSEGFSYWQYGDSHNWFGLFPGNAGERGAWQGGGGRDRVQTEEFARDSFENLLFSVCRFKQVARRYPEKITVVSLPFKEARFRDLHRSALRYPKERFSFVGVGTSTAETLKGEKLNAFSLFQGDPHGCRPPLSDKKRFRNPFHASIPYPSGCEDMAALFEHCAANIYDGPLPWDNWKTS